ncbi:hypothetical protein J6590_034419 [Homalodisca vitripennis]|nr:hypothetical protein J6590_034419 [Homalodisca vitripennis]
MTSKVAGVQDHITSLPSSSRFAADILVDSCSRRAALGPCEEFDNDARTFDSGMSFADLQLAKKEQWEICRLINRRQV